MQNICRYMSVKYCKDDRGNQYTGKMVMDSDVDNQKPKA